VGSHGLDGGSVLGRSRHTSPLAGSVRHRHPGGRAQLRNSTAIRRLLVEPYNRVAAQGKYHPSRSVLSGMVLPSGSNWFLSDRGHRSEIVFGVLVIIFGPDGVTGESFGAT